MVSTPVKLLVHRQISLAEIALNQSVMSSESSAKRTLTDAERIAAVASNSAPNDLLSDDLRTRLQNVGSRVRKYVTEGYATQRFGAPDNTNRPPHSSAALFRSANDTLRDVYPDSSKTTSSPSTSSPLKRGRTLWEEEALEGGSRGVTEDIDMGTAAVESCDELMSLDLASRNRPIKPLRRTRRAFTKIHSAPDAWPTRSSMSTNHGNHAYAAHVPSNDVEEDWSENMSEVGDAFAEFA